MIQEGIKKMKRVIAASLLALLLCTGLTACGFPVAVPTPVVTPTVTPVVTPVVTPTPKPVVTPTATPLFTADVTPGQNTTPGSGVPTASPAS